MCGKSRFLWVAVVLIVLGLCITPCMAQNNVGNVSKRGSLLIFPKIETSTYEDTIITIGNDYANSVLVKCYWMDSDQSSWDFVFRLTAYQPVWFRASDGLGSIDVAPFGDDKEGELKCWAIKELPDPDNSEQTIETQISWNFLYGTATLIDTEEPHSIEYNAFAFAARNASRGEPVITPPETRPGTLELNGAPVVPGGTPGYDACPAYLTFNFFAENPSGDINESELSLTPCRQDLRQDASPVCSKVRFDIWNENESKQTGAHQCVKCWFEGELGEIGTETWSGCDLAEGKCKLTGVGGTKFTYGSLKTDMGRFRVIPDSFSACSGVFSKLGQDGKTPEDVCSGNSYRTPFLALLETEILFDATQKEYGTTPTAVGSWVAGGSTQPIPVVLWDPGVGDLSAAKR